MQYNVTSDIKTIMSLLEEDNDFNNPYYVNQLDKHSLVQIYKFNGRGFLTIALILKEENHETTVDIIINGEGSDIIFKKGGVSQYRVLSKLLDENAIKYKINEDKVIMQTSKKGTNDILDSNWFKK